MRWQQLIENSSLIFKPSQNRGIKFDFSIAIVLTAFADTEGIFTMPVVSVIVHILQLISLRFIRGFDAVERFLQCGRLLLSANPLCWPCSKRSNGGGTHLISWGLWSLIWRGLRGWGERFEPHPLIYGWLSFSQ